LDKGAFDVLEFIFNLNAAMHSYALKQAHTFVHEYIYTHVYTCTSILTSDSAHQLPACHKSPWQWGGA